MTAILISLLCLSIVFSIRNNYVYLYLKDLNFRIYEINHIISEQVVDASTAEHLIEVGYSILKAHSYKEYLFKFWKPLKDDYWFNEEQLHFLAI